MFSLILKPVTSESAKTFYQIFEIFLALGIVILAVWGFMKLIDFIVKKEKK